MNLLLHTVLATILVGTTPFTFRTTQGSTSEPAGQSHYPTRVTIDTTGLQHDDFPASEVEKQQALFERDLPSQFLKVRVADAQAEDTAEVRVLFRWENFAEFRYGVTFEVTTPDGKVQEHSLVFQGDGHDLLEHLKGEIPAVIALLERPPKPEKTAPTLPKVTEPETPSKTGEPTPKHTLRWAGVGIGLTGLAAGLTGAFLMPLEEDQPQFEDERIGSESQRRHPLPLTAGLIGIGGAGVLAGVVLIVIDAKRAKTAKRTSVAPTFGNQQVGLTLTGKF